MEEDARSSVLCGDGNGAVLEQDTSNVEAFSIADWLARSDNRCAGAGSSGADHPGCPLSDGDSSGTARLAKGTGCHAAQHRGHAEYRSCRHQHCDYSAAEGAPGRQRQRFRKDHPEPAVFGQEPTGLKKGRFRGDLRQDQGSHRRPATQVVNPPAPQWERPLRLVFGAERVWRKGSRGRFAGRPGETVPSSSACRIHRLAGRRENPGKPSP